MQQEQLIIRVNNVAVKNVGTKVIKIHGTSIFNPFYLIDHKHVMYVIYIRAPIDI